MVLKKIVISVIFFLFPLAGIAYLQLPVANQTEERIDKQEAIKQEKQEQLTLDLLRSMPDVGFNNLIADWTYLQFIQYFGDRARDLTGYRLNPEYFRVFVEKDPRFIAPYFIFAPATTLFSGRPDLSVQLMSEGLQSISPEQPLAYQVWYYKGVDELLFVGKPAQARLSYEMAAQWADYHDDEASQRAARLARQTADFLAKNPESKRAQAAAWMSIFVNAREDRTRDLALQNIRRLGGKITIQGNVVSLTFPEQD